MHSAFKRKLYFIMHFDLVRQTCFSDGFNAQLLRHNLKLKKKIQIFKSVCGGGGGGKNPQRKPLNDSNRQNK